MRFRSFGLLLGFFMLTGAAAQNITLEEVVEIALQKNYDVRVLQTTSALAANDNRYASALSFR